MIYMNEQDAPVANLAECFITKDGQRIRAIFAKNFEAKMNIKTKEVPVLGKLINGRKAVGAELPFKMTIYKATEIFDDIVEEYKNTGLLPTFDIQVTNYDKAAEKIGRSTKIYKQCILDGDVLLSAFDVEGETIEQEISGYCSDFERPEKYSDLPEMF